MDKTNATLHWRCPLGAALLFLCLLLAAGKAVAQPLAYRVSFLPDRHYIDVELTAHNLSAPVTLFKMPVWAPGYYLIVDYPKNLSDFHVEDLSGKTVAWQKEGKNGWRVANGEVRDLRITYRVYANARSVAEAMVTPEKAFVPGNGVYLYIDGEKGRPVTLAFDLPAGWKRVATGLEPIPGRANTFRAADADVLYDSPVYLGNPAIYDFTLEGIPYEIALETPDGVEQTAFVADMQRVVRTATRLMGDIPYRRYSFLLMGAGGGGLEHQNSQACFTGGSFRFANKEDYLRFVSFITHEFFHLYNVKAIRPIELGPFDYDREVFTPSLWVSEGLTVYYESRLLYDAGLVDGAYVRRTMSNFIRTVEEKEGHRHMSLRQSSYDIWLNFFNRNGNAKETTISYYDKGPVIGLFMDIEIRRLTQGRRSLDDLMRLLYHRFYRERQRGFTEAEFWDACTEVAGSPLTEIRRYVETTEAIDYQKYLGYAGWTINSSYEILPKQQIDTSAGTVELFR